MKSVIENLKSLSFICKLQVIRMVILLQAIGLHVLLYLAKPFVDVFYLEVWVGLSWLIIFSLVAAELALDLRLSSEVS